MSHIPNLVKAILALVTLLAVGVVLVLLFGSQAGPPATPVARAPHTSPPYPPPASPTLPSPSVIPTASGPTPIPRCAFAAAPVTTVTGISLDKFAFSEPREVLTHTSAIDIAGWLPDGERILITRRIPNQSRETIETFNVRTGEIRRYAERHSLSSKPVWLAAQQAVAFIDATLVEGRAWWSLRLGHGEGQPVETLQTDLAFPELAADPAGRQVSVLLRDQGARPIVIDVAKNTSRSLSIQLPVEPWLTSPETSLTFEHIYHMAWSPKGKWLACYSMDGFYLLEAATGQICLMDLGDCPRGGPPGKCWALDAQWSPDERYLAVVTTAGRLPVDFIDLTLIDMYTDKRHRPDLQSLRTIAWVPNSHNLLAAVKMGTDEKGIHLDGLYILDIDTGDTRQILADHRFVGTGYWGVAWSPAGQAFALVRLTLMPTEPTIAESHLCIVSVEVRQ